MSCRKGVSLFCCFPPQLPTYPTEPSVTQWNSPCWRARLFKAPGLLHKHRLLVLLWLTVQVSQQVLLNKICDKAWLCFTVFEFLGELFRWCKCSSACICVKLQNYKTQPLVSLKVSDDWNTKRICILKYFTQYLNIGRDDTLCK